MRMLQGKRVLHGERMLPGVMMLPAVRVLQGERVLQATRVLQRAREGAMRRGGDAKGEDAAREKGGARGEGAARIEGAARAAAPLSTEKALFLGARWDEVGWQGGGQRDTAFAGQRRVLEGQAPYGRGGGGWVGEGCCKWSECCSRVARGVFWSSRLWAGMGNGLGLVGFTCAAPAWVWVAVGAAVGVMDQGPQQRAGAEAKEKTVPKRENGPQNIGF